MWDQDPSLQQMFRGGQLDALRLILNERIVLPGAFPVLPPKPASR